MKKVLYIFLIMFTMGAIGLQAQVNHKVNKTNVNANVDDDEEDEEDENEDEEDEDSVAMDSIYVNPEDKDMPEGMIQENLDSLMKEYHTMMYLKPDANCNMKDENPEFTEDVYVNRLQKMPTIIEMPYNDIVRKFIDKYAIKLRRQVSLMIGAQNFYIPFFEQALDAYQMPLELKYLPVVESALNPKAVSRVGATGLWQFMITTGKQYGLKINSLKDERCDPELASMAAAHYLKNLYNLFGDWHLAIAAYNCGPGNVNKAINRAGGVKDYWQIYPYLPAETRGYVPAFIAANYIMNYYCEHGICPMITTLPAQTDTIIVNRDINLRQIASVMNLDIDMLRAINPMYRHDIVNGSDGGTILRLPADQVNNFIDNEDSICKFDADNLLKKARVEVNDAPVQYRTYRHSYYRSYGRHHHKKDKKHKKGKKNKKSKKEKKHKKSKKSKKSSKKKGKKKRR